MSEANLQRRIQRALKAEGAWVVKYHSSAVTRRGIPDLLICHRGRFIALEVKLPGGKPTEHQQAELDAIASAGGGVAIVTTVDEALSVVLGPAPDPSPDGP